MLKSENSWRLLAEHLLAKYLLVEHLLAERLFADVSRASVSRALALIHWLIHLRSSRVRLSQPSES